MATEDSATKVEPDPTPDTSVFVGGPRTVAQALLAALGTLSILSAIEAFTGYTSNPAIETFFVVLLLGFGYTLLFLAVSGVLAAAIDHAVDG